MKADTGLGLANACWRAKIIAFAMILLMVVPVLCAQKMVMDSPPDRPAASQLHSAASYAAMLISGALLTTCVLLHFEVLKLLTALLGRLHTSHRTRILVLIIGLMIAHLVEVIIFSFGYYLTDGRPGFGYLWSAMPRDPLDYAYFSFVTYLTIGYGDMVPVGAMRFLAALEALSGILMVGWSVSFTFLEMQRFWGRK